MGMKRRELLQSAAAGLTILKSGTLRGQNAPSNKLNIALIGVSPHEERQHFDLNVTTPRLKLMRIVAQGRFEPDQTIAPLSNHVRDRFRQARRHGSDLGRVMTRNTDAMITGTGRGQQREVVSGDSISSDRSIW